MHLKAFGLSAGNLLATKEGQLVYLDFGKLASLNPRALQSHAGLQVPSVSVANCRAELASQCNCPGIHKKVLCQFFRFSDQISLNYNSCFNTASLFTNLHITFTNGQYQ